MPNWNGVRWTAIERHMDVERIDHTAIVVRDLDEAIARYRSLLGIEPGARGVVEDQHIALAFLSIGDTQLELIQPTDEDSGVARFLARRGESLHHIAVRVPDIRAALAKLTDQGVELIDREPRPGFHGQIAFVHPRALDGVLLELVEG